MHSCFAKQEASLESGVFVCPLLNMSIIYKALCILIILYSLCVVARTIMNLFTEGGGPVPSPAARV